MRPRDLHRSLLFAALPLFVAAGLAHAQTLSASLVTDMMSRPTNLASPPGDLHRLFVTEQWTGRIRIVRDGHVLQAPFLTVGGLSNDGEQGLLGLAFHPNYSTNGKFYVDFTDAAGTTVIRQYTVSATDPDLADPASALTILEIPHPVNTNHNGGQLQFGPDGFLYQGMGDGGASNDPPNNAQNIDVLLGKVLRIDVDGDDFPADATRNYRIPPGNPFAGATPGADEIFFFGLRNPWRFSFDRVTGDMLLSDVGQGAVEEINFIPSNVGGLNFGWRCMEGTTCTGLTGCTCNDVALTLPFHTYDHALGCSIVGGYVYRGTNTRSLRGTYFFADYCSNTIWSLQYAPGVGVTNLIDRTAQLEPAGSQTIQSIHSFGEDARGELYIIEEDGQIWRIDGPPPGTPTCAADGLSGTMISCPCAGNGYPGHGCPNSRAPTGALLMASGSTNPDTVLLTATELPGAASTIFLVGDAIDANGELFGDGVRCVTGTMTRMRMKTAISGTACFPDFHLADPSVSARSGVTPGSGLTRFYQAYYRNTAVFCMPESFNITNGYQITW